MQENNKNNEQSSIEILASLVALGDNKQAIECFFQISPAEYHYDLAIADLVTAYINSKQYDKVFLWVDKISPSSSCFSFAVVSYLVALLGVEAPNRYKDEFNKAIAYFKNLSASDYLYPIVLRYMLRVLSEYGKFQKLLKYSNYFLELMPNHPLGLYFKGEALYELEKYDTALQCLNEIHDNSPEYIDALYVKALIHEKFDNEEEAQKCWQEIEQAESLTSFASFAIEADDFKAVVDYKRDIIQKNARNKTV